MPNRPLPPCYFGVIARRPPAAALLGAVLPRAALLVTALLLTGWAAPARAAAVSAGQAEAKEVAKSQGNCTPGKVEVMRYSVGREGQTVFKVACTEDKDAFVLVQCRSRACSLLR